MKRFLSQRAFAASLFIAALPFFLPAAALAQIKFDPAVNSTTGSITVGTKIVNFVNPDSVAVGDFNNDTNLDIAVLNGIPIRNGANNEFYLSILFGNGDGTFVTPATTILLASCLATKALSQCDQPVYVTAGNFDGDSIPDLAVVFFGIPTPDPVVPGSVAIFLSNGDGTFTQHDCNGVTAGLNCNVGKGAVFAATGLFTSSTHLDLAVINRQDNNGNPGTVSILLGNGAGGFTPTNCDTVTPALTCPVGTSPVSMAIDYLDGDANLDLAVANFGGNNISLLKGNGSGGFKNALTFPALTIPTGLEPIVILSGDFDRDGKEDLAVAGQQSKLVTIHLGNNDGTFPKTKKVSIGKIPVAMVAADFNGDTVLDLATVQFPGHTVTVFPGVGDGTFSRATALKATGGGIGNFDVAVGDFNNNTLTDNKPDLAVPNGKISVFLNTSDFPTAGFHIDVTSPTGASAWTSGAPPPTITWDWSGFGGNVKIEFSANSGDTYKTLVSSIPNSGPPGTANLTKGPTTKTPITTARIRVCSVVFPGICGQSPDFSLTP